MEEWAQPPFGLTRVEAARGTQRTGELGQLRLCRVEHVAGCQFAARDRERSQDAPGGDGVASANKRTRRQVDADRTIRLAGEHEQLQPSAGFCDPLTEDGRHHSMVIERRVRRVDTCMEFQDVVQRRRMVRNFDARPLDHEVVERIVANALRAPSAGFTQGWAFLVLEGKTETERFWKATFASAEARARFRRQGLFAAPLIVVSLSHKDAYLDRYAEPDKGWTDRSESHWPVPYWDVDAGFASILMLLTAVDAGLGALFFGVFEPERFRVAFGVPDAYTPVGALAIGHPLPDDPSPSLGRGRRPLDAVVHRGRW